MERILDNFSSYVLGYDSIRKGDLPDYGLVKGFGLFYASLTHSKIAIFGAKKQDFSFIFNIL